MNITRIEELNSLSQKEIIYSKKDLENEYDAYISIKIVSTMLDNGLITLQEKDAIIARIVEQFTPYLSHISTQIT